MPKVSRSRQSTVYNYSCGCGYSIKCNTNGQRTLMRNAHKKQSCPLETVLIVDQREPIRHLRGVQIPEDVIEERRLETIANFLQLQ
jgi:hypothetical protein